MINLVKGPGRSITLSHLKHVLRNDMVDTIAECVYEIFNEPLNLGIRYGNF